MRISCSDWDTATYHGVPRTRAKQLVDTPAIGETAECREQTLFLDDSESSVQPPALKRTCLSDDLHMMRKHGNEKVAFACNTFASITQHCDKDLLFEEWRALGKSIHRDKLEMQHVYNLHHAH